MDENKNKAFNLAYDATKHLVTLSTGIIALTITFLRDLNGNKGLIIGSWFFFLMSIIFGQITLMAITGSLNKNCDDIYSKNIKIPATAQFLSFLIGLLLVIINAIDSI